MDWAKDYIRRALAGIPNSAYKNRLRGELADHLALLASDLEAAGYAPEEAQAEALRQMGDAKALCEGYRAEWLRQPESRRWDLILMVYGCLLAGVCAAVVYVPLMLLWVPYTGWLSHTPAWIADAALYLCAMVPNALLLRRVFRGREKRRALMISGLLLTWCVGLGALPLGIRLFMPSYSQIVFHTAGGLQTLKWFTWPYLAGTLAGTLLTGWLFSGKKRAEK